ncbi:Thiol:disulfide interchange protein DsbE [Candidatus Arcanobacter lacustris]|jgi:cytochrome c biogenesis protein CcmG/thiol:disulfide interchange protein DsbE|uniref:Thiol:disulfide interchange protein DsbE n=1 Tax=Candidatus Arcanibacter lacustris TaxID=1607817 RepID=A0A0F5MPK9_9RICK|nr:Thiol:disulfide interchange protein DsbE [Candidatus Arcanobacter lacustris]
MKIKPLLSLLIISTLFVVLYNTIASDKKSVRTVPLPEFTLPLVGNESKQIGIDDIKGEVFIMNFFATWCKVCLQEHNYLVSLSKQIATPIYGVSIRDHDQNIEKLLKHFGNPYKLVLSDIDGYSSTIPIRGLPTTILVNENGDIISSHSGAMSKSVFDHKFLPYMSARDKE